jgi:hypothetical protein
MTEIGVKFEKDIFDKSPDKVCGATHIFSKVCANMSRLDTSRSYNRSWTNFWKSVHRIKPVCNSRSTFKPRPKLKPKPKPKHKPSR